MGSPRRSKSTIRAGSLLPKPNGPRLAERRQTFHRHLQSWAYNHIKRCAAFDGWIAPTLDSRSYALNRPVACFVRSATGDGSYVRIHLKLSRRRPSLSSGIRKHRSTLKRGHRSSIDAPQAPIREALSADQDYQAMIKSGSDWVTDEVWFADLADSQSRQDRARTLPYHLRSGSSAAKTTTEQLAATKSAPMPAQSIGTGDWLRLGPPLRLLELPLEVRLQIFDYVLQLPETLLFDGERLSNSARSKPREASALHEFLSCSLVPSRQLHSEVNSLLYSTTTFAFHQVDTLFDFLKNIGHTKRAFVRKLRLQLSHYEYFDVFTPDWVIGMLDVPVWSHNCTAIRSFLSGMQIEQFTIRLKDSIASHPRSAANPDSPVVRDLTSIDNPWVYLAVKDFFPHARFESAAWPHRDPVQNIRWSRDSLIHAAQDVPWGSFLGLWLDRTPKSLFLREQRRLQRKVRCRIGCEPLICHGECTAARERTLEDMRELLGIQNDTTPLYKEWP